MERDGGKETVSMPSRAQVGTQWGLWENAVASGPAEPKVIRSEPVKGTGLQVQSQAGAPVCLSVATEAQNLS